MSQSFHVSGVSTLSFNGSTLGSSVDGVDMEFETQYEDVIADILGSKIPSDIQYMGEIITVTAELIYYDLAVLKSALGGFNGLTGGTTGTIGKLFYQQSGGNTLLITVNPSGAGVTGSEPNWTFPHAYLTKASGFKVGTTRSVCAVSFRCLHTSDGGTIYS